MTKSKEIKHLEAGKQLLIERLQNFVFFMETIEDDCSNKSILTKIKIHLDSAREFPERYQELCAQLDAISNEDTGAMTPVNFYNAYLDASSRATLILENLKDEVINQPIHQLNTSSTTTNNGANAKLPRILLPSYDGTYTEFQSFFETFTSLIHDNVNLSDIEKFMYLKGCCVGPAEKTIANIQPSGSNYKVAFDLLCERYNNPKLIILNHVKGIIELKPIVKNNSGDLRKLYDDYLKHIRALQNLSIPVEDCAAFIYCILMSKLDAYTKSKFTEYKPKLIPTLNEINEFLKRQCEVMEEIDTNKNSNNVTQSESFTKNKPTAPNNYRRSLVLTAEKSIVCPSCKGNHYLNHCPNFLTLTTQQRYNKAYELKICRNCLRHSSKNLCKSKLNCTTCNKRHNNLLHFERSSAIPNSEPGPSTAGNPAPITSTEVTVNNNANANTQSALFCYRSNDVLLPTACVKILSNENKWHVARVILDTGSHCNLLSEEFAKKLNLKRNKTNIQILGINSCSSQSNSAVNLKIASLHNDFKTSLQCLTISSIAKNLPLRSFDKSSLNIPENIRLSDENFNKSLPIDLLIGAGNYYNLMCVGQISLGKNRPVLQKTLLGWVVSGCYHSNQGSSATVHSNLTLREPSGSNDNLDNFLRTFWQLENVEPQNPLSKLSIEEAFCETHFAETTHRDNSGRFIVSVPYNTKLSQLGESKEQAFNRFLHLERKLLKNHELHIEYSNCIQEYIALGHMTKVEPHLENQPSTVDTPDSKISISDIPPFFLPHHAVFKLSSLTTKLRVVFDGSAKSSSNISINDAQIVGPVIQDDLVAILLRFRKHQIALTGDIEKMYRQILVRPPERKFQQILWRQNPNKPIEIYQLNRITYGTSSASYLATKCLQHLAVINADTFPNTCRVLKSDFYMDDLLTGGDTIQEVLKIRDELTSILASAGFPIRKFLSNSTEVLLSNSVPESSLFTVPLCERENSKALGVCWDSKSDVIRYNTQVKVGTAVSSSKRNILSIIAQLFDPLGLLSPIIINGKLLIQKLWQIKITWDESIPQHLNSEWELFKSQLHLLNTLRIPRCVIIPNALEIDVHGFSDSSSNAYGACVYIKSLDSYGKVSCHLVTSKSRVAPLQGVTIPRLELCAALLLAELVQKVRCSLSLSFNKTYLWSDSTIVLNWIRSVANKYKIFVANRIAAIQELSDPGDWFYVPSKQNPADLVSRGCSVTDLISNSLWWHGPSYLVSSKDDWPEQVHKSASQTPGSELKVINPNTNANLLVIQSSTIFQRFSSLTTLKRVVAWMLRFIKNSQINKYSRSLKDLQASELQHAMNVLIRLCQNETFHHEIRCLKAKQPLKSNTNILPLNPFLDKNGLLRVGGRIQNSSFGFSKKFPILLPKHHPLTKLIFDYFHKSMMHCGAQQLVASIREYYWPIAARSEARQTIHNCTKCFRADPKGYIPLMGDLPAKRLEYNTTVFTNVGIDYAGPISIKDRKLRGSKQIKSYICLFVCLVTKAIHLELVTDLSTNAFLATLKRFIGRRGIPASITSDNATNFKGASNELKEINMFLNTKSSKEKVSGFMATHNIKWDFIIPRNPHQGGMWESGIKCVKTHLKRVLGNTCLDYENFSTLLIQIEATLNSRPLSPLTNDPSDTNPLTPGHFLIGKPLCTLPENDLVSVNEARLTTYQRIQRLVQHFWKRWCREVIPEMQRRIKWYQHMPDLLKLNSLALIKEDNLPPLQWLLGRVVEVHVHPDNVIRSATLRLANGHLLKRSVNKLCVLPVV